MQPPEGSMGWGRRFHVIARVMLVAGERFHLPPLVGLSVRQLKCPHDLGTDSPRDRDPEKTVRDNSAFDNVASEVIGFSFGHILFARSELLNAAHMQREGN